MWDFIVFIKERLVSISGMLNNFTFNIADVDVSLLEILLGFVIMGFIISVFWKGART